MGKTKDFSKKQLHLSLGSYFIGNLSSGIFNFVLSLYVLKATDSSFSFSLILMLGPLATILGSPLVGQVVDRYPHKSIALAAQLSSILLVSLSMLLFTKFQTTLGIVLIAGALAFWLTLCDDFQTIAYKASTLNLVAKADHQKLITGEQTISALMMLVAPILGGVLYPVFTLKQIMFLEVVGEAWVFFSLLRLDFTAFGSETRTDKRENILSGSFAGLRYIKEDQLLKALLIFGVVANLVLTAVEVGDPVVLVKDLGVSAHAYGWIMSSLALGMIVGSILMGNIKVKQGKCRFTAKVSFLMVVSLLAMALVLLYSSTLLVSAVFTLSLFLLGSAICLANVPYALHMRTEVAVEKQGRINATAAAILELASPLGLFVFGTLFQYLSPGAIFFFASVILAVVGSWLYSDKKEH